jgi:hypothetical protein
MPDDCYMTLDMSKPSKTADFGVDGCTASLGSWHELLQLTVPDNECGVVFVRGDFPDSVESILARAQRRSEKETWGLGIRITEDTDYVTEKTPAQGMINLRWPCTIFNIVRQSKLLGSVKLGSYTMCSFVKDGTLYQIARFSPSETVFGDSIAKVTLDVGGMIRFGCSNSNVLRPGDLPVSFCDNYIVDNPEDRNERRILSCTSQCHEMRLDIRLWVNRRPISLQLHKCRTARLSHSDPEGHPEYHDEIAAVHAFHEVNMFDDKALTCVASFSLVKSSAPKTSNDLRMVRSDDVQEYLGVSDASYSAPYRLWARALGQLPSPEAFELNSIGRVVEQILCVSSVPVHQQEIIESPSITTLGSHDSETEDLRAPPQREPDSHPILNPFDARSGPALLQEEYRRYLERSLPYGNTSALLAQNSQHNQDLEGKDLESETATDNTDENSRREGPNHSDATKGAAVALIKNIISNQVVDLCSVL